MKSWIKHHFTEDWLRSKIAERKSLRGPYFYDPFAIAEIAGATYQEEPVKRVVTFFEKCLVHVKGEHEKKPFVLEEWQIVDIIAPLFGFFLPSGYRLFRVIYIELPRKNGKSTLLAGIELYLLFADREPGAEIVTAATSREQAHIVFSVAEQMVRSSKTLSERAYIYKLGSIAVQKTYNVLTAISAIPRHGKNLHGLGIDELHEHQNEELIDSLRTSMGSRRQPVTIYITTAGLNKGSICWKEREYASALINKQKQDIHYLPVIYSAEAAIQEDPHAWKKPAVWAIANPGLGISIHQDYLHQEMKKAEFSAANEATFKRLYLNIWSSLSAKWLYLKKWKECHRNFDLSEFAGEDCYLGFDASATRDLTALVATFRRVEDDGKDHYYSFFWHWLPASRLLERKNHEGIDWKSFVDSGELELTDSEAVDQTAIAERIAEIEAIGIKIKQIGYDQWNAHFLVNELTKKGYEMVKVGQSVGSISGPSKEFERLILDGRYHSNQNDLLEMQVEKVEIYSDANGNIKPVKGMHQTKKKGGQVAKIDGIIAAIIALSRAFEPATEEKIAQNIYS